MSGPDEIDRARAVGRHEHREPGALQIVRGDLRDLSFVFDDENGHQA
jgi:hypothetical protein